MNAGALAVANRVEHDKDKRIVELEAENDKLRNLLRDVHDVTFVGEQISEGLMDRIRSRMARGK